MVKYIAKYDLKTEWRGEPLQIPKGTSLIYRGKTENGIILVDDRTTSIIYFTFSGEDVEKYFKKREIKNE